MEPEQLRPLLWEAVAVGDAALRWKSCAGASVPPSSSISRPGRKVPAEIRERPDLAEAYVQTMVTIARLFAEKLDDPSLLQSLMGQPRTTHWCSGSRSWSRCKKEMDALVYSETVDLLNNLLIDCAA